MRVRMSGTDILTFIVLGFSLLNALHMSFSRRNEYA